MMKLSTYYRDCAIAGNASPVEFMNSYKKSLERKAIFSQFLKDNQISPQLDSIPQVIIDFTIQHPEFIVVFVAEEKTITYEKGIQNTFTNIEEFKMTLNLVGKYKQTTVIV